MRRVVITGIGVVSCLGNNQNEVYESLLHSKSGITFSEEYKEYNLKSNIHGKPNINLEDHVDRKFIRFMGPGSAYNYISMAEAVKDAGLEENEVSNISTGMIMGSGGPSIENVILASNIAVIAQCISSLPPANTISCLPIWINSIEFPIQWPLVAHAELIV